MKKTYISKNIFKASGLNELEGALVDNVINNNLNELTQIRTQPKWKRIARNIHKNNPIDSSNVVKKKKQNIDDNGSNGMKKQKKVVQKINVVPEDSFAGIGIDQSRRPL